MARTGGTYALPNPDVETNTAITISWANTTLADLETEMTDSLSRTGSGGMLAQLALNEGGSAAAPDLSWTSETSSGWYMEGTNSFRFAIAGSDKLYVTTTGTTTIGAHNASSLWGTTEDAVLDDITTLLTLTHASSGTPAVGIGVGIDLLVETLSTASETVAQIETVATNVGDGTEEFDLAFNLMTAGAAAAEVARFQSTGELDLASGGKYQIAGTTVLEAGTLGGAVLASSLTSLGTITNLIATDATFTGISDTGTIDAGTWQGTPITDTYMQAAAIGTVGAIDIATLDEVNTGTDTLKAVTPDTLERSDLKVDVDSIVRVQTCSVDSAGTTRTNETGGTWNSSRDGLGVYSITFPTTASAATAQMVIAGIMVTATLTTERTAQITDITTTDCKVRTFAAGSAADSSFTISRVVG